MAEHKEIGRLIKQMVNKPAKEDQLDPATTDKLFGLLKKSKVNIGIAQAEIFKLLEKPHAQARFNCLLMMDVVFYKSQSFRDGVLQRSSVLVDNLLVQSLKPIKWSKKLKLKAKDVFKGWNKTFPGNPRLISLSELADGIEVDEESEVDERAEFSNKLRLAKYLKFYEHEFPEMESKMQSHKRELVASVDLLLPSFEIEKDAVVNPSVGIAIGPTYSIEIDLKEPVLYETPENRPIYDAVRENMHVLSKLLGKLNDIIKEVTVVNDPNLSRHESRLKNLLDWKNDIKDLLQKGNSILEKTVDQVESDEDEEFETISNNEGDDLKDTDTKAEKERTKTRSPFIHVSSGLKPVFEEVIEQPRDLVQDNIQTNTNDPELKDLFERAPVVPYGEDLHYWSQSAVPFQSLSTHSGLDFHHRFLGDGPSDKMVSDETLAELKKRQIYLNQDQPTIFYPQCRAMTKNGTLCTRRDMEKCPFHGPIVERDEFGEPLTDSLPVNRSQTSLALWETIESDVNLTTFAEEPRERLDPIEKRKLTTKERLLKKVKRLEKKSVIDPTADHVFRDRQVFRW